jgi:hypothetical protein
MPRSSYVSPPERVCVFPDRVRPYATRVALKPSRAELISGIAKLSKIWHSVAFFQKSLLNSIGTWKGDFLCLFDDSHSVRLFKSSKTVFASSFFTESTGLKCKFRTNTFSCRIRWSAAIPQIRRHFSFVERLEKTNQPLVFHPWPLWGSTELTVSTASFPDITLYQYSAITECNENDIALNRCCTVRNGAEIPQKLANQRILSRESPPKLSFVIGTDAPSRSETNVRLIEKS